MSLFDDIILAIGYVLGWAPWIALFLCAWKRNILPLKWADQVFGETESTPGIRGVLKYLVIPGAMSLGMNIILWVTLVPPDMLQWKSFPRFCIVPRTVRGLFQVHQACWHHLDFMHYSMNNFCLWTLGPLVLSYNRRTFVASVFFIGLVGGFVLWLLGPSNTCIVGFSGVLFGWFGLILAALPLECPPKWWRLLLLIVVFFFLASTFMREVIGGDDDKRVSWHGHAIGFLSGVLFGYLRFRRGWFLCEGLEDRVRPANGVNSLCTALGALARELARGSREGAADLWDMVRCRPPPPRSGSIPRAAASSAPTGDPPPQKVGEPSFATPSSASASVPSPRDAFGNPMPRMFGEAAGLGPRDVEVGTGR
mmetsp:Transcript_41959/g.115746  ORF Transcript_41959/g.115746 Transcript_41959/m.115746 type:complete len:366 (-) Transcript_41959:212-1309(-)